MLILFVYRQNEVKKSAGARADKAIDGLNKANEGLNKAVDGANKAIEVQAEVVKGVNQDNTMLANAMNMTNQLAAYFFQIPVADGGANGAPLRQIAEQPAAPLRQIEHPVAPLRLNNGGDTHGPPIVEGIEELNIGEDGKENVATGGMSTPKRPPKNMSTPERRPKSTRPKSVRSKKKPTFYADEYCGDGYGID